MGLLLKGRASLGVKTVRAEQALRIGMQLLVLLRLDSAMQRSPAG